MLPLLAKIPRTPRLGKPSKRSRRKDALFIKKSELNPIERVDPKEVYRLARLKPWYVCQLTQLIPSNPVVTPWGTVYELTSIAPYIRKHKKCPRTQQPLKLQDLTRILVSTEKSSGKRICPVTSRWLDENSNVVCIRTSGRVYSKEALPGFGLSGDEGEGLYNLLEGGQASNIAGIFRDPVSSEPFGRKDVITIQNPIERALAAESEKREAERINHDERMSGRARRKLHQQNALPIPTSPITDQQILF